MILIMTEAREGVNPYMDFFRDPWIKAEKPFMANSALLELN